MSTCEPEHITPLLRTFRFTLLLSVSHVICFPGSQSPGQAGSEIGWDPGPFAIVAAVLPHGQTSSGVTKYKETIGTKNNCMHVQLEKMMSNKIQKN